VVVILAAILLFVVVGMVSSMFLRVPGVGM